MAHEREPLLQQRQTGAGNAGALPSLARTVLKFLMWAVFLTWAAGIFLYPTKPVQAVFSKWVRLTKESMFGIAGTVSTKNSALLLLFTPV